MGFAVYSGEWKKIQEEKRRTKARHAVFLTPLNPLGQDPEEEKPHSDDTIPQKAPYETKWKRNQDAVYWVRLQEAQDQGLEFWQTKSFAIMTNFTIPGDCIDRAAAQNGDRVLFERLGSPKPAPKVTLKRNWQSQQPQQPISHTDDPVSGNREQHGKARQKCKTTRNTSQKRTKPPRNWGIPLLT